ncbi:hypothetical protein [Bizionia argentinensis]|uniref:hypothetical protein n=1 Tax=Bizionia argentinensis TaxID=456455 RepID=UPI00022327F4|nr:hypothetical protein [Bizionia argentinensis]
MIPTDDGAAASTTRDIGGLFVFNPVPADGASINPISSTITHAVLGDTYTFDL